MPASPLPAAQFGATPAKTKHLLAGAARRVTARFLDLLLMTLVAIGIGTLFVYSNVIDQSRTFYEVMRSFFVRDIQSSQLLDTLAIDQWRLIGFAFCTWLAYLAYFTVIPIFTRGRTLFSWMFFMRTVELNNANMFFLHLLVRDMFVWIVPVSLGVVVVLVTTSGNLGELFSNFSFDQKYSSDAGPIVFKALYAADVLVALVLLGYMFVKNKRLALHDQMSRTAVVVDGAEKIIRDKPAVSNDIKSFPGGGTKAVLPSAE